MMSQEEKDAINYVLDKITTELVNKTVEACRNYEEAIGTLKEYVELLKKAYEAEREFHMRTCRVAVGYLTAQDLNPNMLEDFVNSLNTIIEQRTKNASGN